jgi:SAM-dependent methyltransferase
MVEPLRRVIGRAYSLVADNLYEPVVVKGAFRLFGGDLNALVLEQGRHAVRAADGRPILDLPVGTGFFTMAMGQGSTGLVVGADLAWGMVRHSARDARAGGVENLVTVQADAHNLPFRDQTFAAVVCSNGLQVMPGLERNLAELARVLADDGTLFVSVVSVPLSAVLPDSASDHLPVLLRSGRDIAATIGGGVLRITKVSRSRFAWLIEARKTAGGGS